MRPSFIHVVGLAAAVGCVSSARRGRGSFDSSWGPLQADGHLTAMTPTLLLDDRVQMQLPTFPVHQQVLPSGLRLGTETGETRGMVAVVTVVGSGSGADPPDHEGLAHLVEHLVYHARDKADRTQSERLARLGARHNAGTGVDATQFYEVAPASALTGLLEVAADRIARPLAGVDEADFERERAIVENEVNQRNETGVYGQVVSWLQAKFFPPGHPYARPIGGNRVSLRRLTLADARAFAAQNYRPSNVDLLVTGEAAVTAVPTKVASRLPDSIAAKSAASPRPASTALQAAVATGATDHGDPRAGAGSGARPVPIKADAIKAAVALPEIWIAYDLGGGGYDSAIARILTTRAAETSVREKLNRDPDVLGVEFNALRFGQRTMLACQIVLENDKRRDAIASWAEGVIWQLWSDARRPSTSAWPGWHKDTVGDLRQAALADAIFVAEPFVARSLERASAFHMTGEVAAYDRILTTIGAVQPHEVSGRAFTLLAPERARTLFLDPLPEAQRPAPGLVGVQGGDGDNPHTAMTRPEISDIGTPPRASAPAGLRDARVMTLVNGLTVVLVPRPQFPSVTALLGFHGGRAALPPGVLEMVRILEGPLSRFRHPSTLEISQFDGRGFTADFVRTDRRRLSNALFSLVERLRIVAETDWQRLLTRAQEQADRTEPPSHDEPTAIATAQILAALYGNHPYGRRLQRRDLLALDPALAPEWLPRLYNPRNGFVVIVGDFDVDAAAWLVSGWFGRWPVRPDAGQLTAPPVPPPGARPLPEKVFITPRPVTSQVEVAFACRLGFPTTGRERVAHRMIAGLLGGYLSTQIREAAGAAYSVASEASAFPGAGAHLSVEMSVDTHRLRDALRVLRAEIDALAKGRFDKNAFAQVRFGLASQESLHYQTGFSTAAEILEAFSLGVPLQALATDADEIARVTERDLVRAFAPCLSSRVLSLIGNEAAIRAAM